jgi:hypothetical protein
MITIELHEFVERSKEMLWLSVEKDETIAIT